MSHLAVAGYRALQNLTLPLGQLTLVCGANGSGMSNLYRSLVLIAAAARGDLVAALAAEGGLSAVFWAGPQRSREPARLRLGFAGESLSYAIELGFGVDDQTSAFALDPVIKREWIWAGGPFHPRRLALALKFSSLIPPSSVSLGRDINASMIAVRVMSGSRSSADFTHDHHLDLDGWGDGRGGWPGSW